MNKKLFKIAKGLDFETIDELFNYVNLSRVNGNKKQCKELMKSIIKADGGDDFLVWMKDNLSKGQQLELHEINIYA